MTDTSQLAQHAIEIFQQNIALMSCTPLVHFELEGCCVMQNGKVLTDAIFQSINQQLRHHDIEADLVSEYWHNQWEYVSKFAGQTPLKEAQNLAKSLRLLPELFQQFGAKQTLIKPVVWSGDSGQLAYGSKNIFTDQQRAVHIPNAIQVNVSVMDNQGRNLVAHSDYGEILQACLINTSLACSLLYLPEPDAYERLALKTKYGLVDELCSPTDISGGHQGSIALYKQQGKHNQPLGITPLVIDQHQQPLVCEQRWEETARVEHRLGASSEHYNPYVNVAFTLGNVVDALEMMADGCYQAFIDANKTAKQLPQKLSGSSDGFDALNLFKNDQWFIERINRSAKRVNKDCGKYDLGQHLHRSIVESYQAASNQQLWIAGQAI